MSKKYFTPSNSTKEEVSGKIREIEADPGQQAVSLVDCRCKAEGCTDFVLEIINPVIGANGRACFLASPQTLKEIGAFLIQAGNSRIN